MPKIKTALLGMGWLNMSYSFLSFFDGSMRNDIPHAAHRCFHCGSYSCRILDKFQMNSNGEENHFFSLLVGKKEINNRKHFIKLSIFQLLGLSLPSQIEWFTLFRINWDIKVMRERGRETERERSKQKPQDENKVIFLLCGDTSHNNYHVAAFRDSLVKRFYIVHSYTDWW